YAAWSGLGTAAVAAVGVIWLGEDLSLTKVAGIALVIAGVVTLELSGRDREKGRDSGRPADPQPSHH
ncbi:SMR family transporter, partial [Georgenia sp. 10Sc9-8]|nr:SMR family transporter [Georgenia halotolerans]